MRDSRRYEREDRERRMPRRMKERDTSKKRREAYLVVACLLLALNVLLLLKMQSQIKGLNKALSQVMNRLPVSGQEELGTPEARVQENVPNQGYYSAGEELPGEEIVDYVSLCGLPQVDKPVKRSQKEVLSRLEELARDSEVIDEIYKNHSSYPDEMLKALANNPEMADFVRNSLDADTEPTGTGLSTLEKGQDHPLFLQWDPRWGYVEYGDSNIGLAGCGPTCVSMALYYLLGDEDITPEKMAEYSTENGYYVMGTGTAWALLEDAPKEYGIRVSQPRASEQTMKSALNQGDIIICSMKSGDFTDGGHFVVVYGYDAKGFLINDPNCVARSREKWSYDRIGKQIKNLWIYSTRQESGSGRYGSNGTGAGRTDPSGTVPSGTDSVGTDSAGADPAEPAATEWAGENPGGTDPAGGSSPGAGSSGTDRPATDSAEMGTIGSGPSEINPPDTGTPDTDGSGGDSTGNDQLGTGSPGTDTPGTDSGGTDSPGTEPPAPDSDFSGTELPGTDSVGTE